MAEIAWSLWKTYKRLNSTDERDDIVMRYICNVMYSNRSARRELHARLLRQKGCAGGKLQHKGVKVLAIMEMRQLDADCKKLKRTIKHELAPSKSIFDRGASSCRRLQDVKTEQSWCHVRRVSSILRGEYTFI